MDGMEHQHENIVASEGVDLLIFIRYCFWVDAGDYKLPVLVMAPCLVSGDVILVNDGYEVYLSYENVAFWSGALLEGGGGYWKLICCRKLVLNVVKILSRPRAWY